jgi:ABC-type glycerol-3-phosphate transport system permease component
MSRYRKNKIKNITCFDYLNVIFMVIVAIATLYPFYYCFVLSFNDGKDALMPGIYFWPRKFTLDNYSFILSNKYCCFSVNICPDA